MMIVIGLFIAYHAMLPHLPNIINPLHPPLDPSVLKERMLYKDLILKESIVDPLFVSGSVFQILLNNASGYFTGSYKIAAVLKGLALTVNIFQFVPFLVGLPESRGRDAGKGRRAAGTRSILLPVYRDAASSMVKL
ncbi:hypothetical protein D9757_007866 [Collybiopsis confluens]|uniref:Uncharacterized protein n=1 Tax=Collybiopsis confluens TaxID=2823264 RepID=A0A8H5HDB0_9AGAR|nr:hypothetical protein D9757_007866 [Collybiopsis confluens]